MKITVIGSHLCPDTLYAHGLIRHQMHVTPVADTQMNVRFGLPLPQK